MRSGDRHAPRAHDRRRDPGEREGEPGRDRVVPGGMMILLEAQNLHSGYGEMEILHGVSMRLDSQEIVTIIGPNGAGKSTLVKTIFGLLRRTAGQLTFKWLDITGKPPRDLVLDGLAYVPQSNNTFPSLSLLKNLEIAAISRTAST